MDDLYNFIEMEKTCKYCKKNYFTFKQRSKVCDLCKFASMKGCAETRRKQSWKGLKVLE